MLNKTLGIFAVTVYICGSSICVNGLYGLLAQSMNLLSLLIASFIALMIAAAAAAWIPFVGWGISAALTAAFT